MFRTFDILLIAVMVAAAAFTYQTKHGAEGIKRRIHALNQEIIHQEDAIDVLNADWALLTQPARIQVISEKFADQLQLQPMDPTQIGDISSIPMRPIADEDRSEDGLSEAKAVVEADQTTTGAVKP